MMIGRWSSMLHPKTGRRIQSQRFTQNANPHVPQTHPKLFIPNSFPPQSQATQSSRQYRDTTQCRGGRDSASQASRLHTISLSTTIERQETHFIYFHSGPPHHTQILGSKKLEEASLLAPAGSGRRGFESLLEHDSKTQLPLCIR